MLNTTQWHDAVITNLTRNSDAFATLNNGERVYISPHFIRDTAYNVGSPVKVKMVPNDSYHIQNGIHWRAYIIQELKFDEVSEETTAEPVDPPPPQRDIKADILEFLDYSELATTAQITRDLYPDWTSLLNDERQAASNKARVALDSLHHDGKVVRADVYLKPDQVKASHTVWALDVHAFTEGYDHD
jgi:hypothetical protein